MNVLEMRVFDVPLKLMCRKCGALVETERFVADEGICRDCRSADLRERRRKRREQ